MSRKKRTTGRSVKRSRRTTVSQPAIGAEEDRRSVAATVGWLLAALATLLGTIVALVVSLAAPSTEGSMLALLAEYLLVASRISGAVALLMTPVVYAVRPDRPPRAVVVAVFAIGAAPWVIHAARLLL
ncbi:MAG TPA: hypothetical protein ENJ50_06710 [Planctomycetaceae bacterium]|nr:hypothetical protein [Planctomycetaceae bacterium]